MTKYQLEQFNYKVSKIKEQLEKEFKVKVILSSNIFTQHVTFNLSSTVTELNTFSTYSYKDIEQVPISFIVHSMKRFFENEILESYLYRR